MRRCIPKKNKDLVQIVDSLIRGGYTWKDVTGCQIDFSVRVSTSVIYSQDHLLSVYNHDKPYTRVNNERGFLYLNFPFILIGRLAEYYYDKPLIQIIEEVYPEIAQTTRDAWQSRCSVSDPFTMRMGINGSAGLFAYPHDLMGFVTNVSQDFDKCYTNRPFDYGWGRGHPSETKGVGILRKTGWPGTSLVVPNPQSSSLPDGVRAVFIHGDKRNPKLPMGSEDKFSEFCLAIHNLFDV